jgi:hypothetical protein
MNYKLEFDGENPGGFAPHPTRGMIPLDPLLRNGIIALNKQTPALLEKTVRRAAFFSGPGG